jgi:transcriptional regulator with XRE-family HTH domain
MRYSDKFGRYLRAVRESKGYSQEYMADRLGIGQSSYACLESGRTALTVERLVSIADILDLDLHQTIDDVLDPAGKRPDAPASLASRAYDQSEIISSLRDEITFLRSLILRGKEGNGTSD